MTVKPRASKQAPLPIATFHPMAGVFPLLEGEAFEALVEDIRAHGLVEPIAETGRQILDGRNRYRACLAAGVEPRFVEVRTDDALGFVLSANLHRRHLNVSQKAMVSARIATLPKGANQHAPIGASSQEDAAKVLNIGRRTGQRARVVLERGIPELIARVDAGEITVEAAEQVALLPVERQRELAGAPEAELKTALKRERRAGRERELAAATQAASTALGSRLYDVIYADPPWRFEPRSRVTGLNRSADNHYPTMGLEDIKNVVVPAGDDSVLFLWATAPMLREALAVVEAWGFDYRTHIVWVKDRVGTGYWARSSHELLLIAARGNVAAPAPGDQVDSVIEAPVRGHSRKPDEFAVLIQTMFPSAARLEMFAREPRAGWDQWGNEATEGAAA